MQWIHNTLQRWCTFESSALQNPKAAVGKGEISDMVRWVILHHGCMFGIHKEKGQAWMLDPYSERIWHLYYAVGGILSTCTLRRNSGCKSKQSRSESSPLAYDETGEICTRKTMPPSIEQEGSLNGMTSVKMMWLICYSLHSHQLRLQPTTSCRGDSGPRRPPPSRCSFRQPGSRDVWSQHWGKPKRFGRKCENILNDSACVYS